MAKKKVIIITSVAITIFILLSTVWFLCIKKEIHKDVSSKPTITNNSKSKQKDEQINVSDNNIHEKENEVKKSEEKVEDNKSSQNNNSVQNNKNENKEPIKETPVQDQPVTQPQSTPQPEPVKEIGPWDAWGMTKDQYYNQPMHSWERVDFKTMNECLNYGDNYEPYLNGEVLYNCREVTSASGNFLGVMFDTEKLN